MTLLKELRTIALGIACCLALATAFAQTPHPAIALGSFGSMLGAADTAPVVALNLGPAGYGCGRISTATYCYNIPVVGSDDDGTNYGGIWLDQSPTSARPFVMFLGNFEGLGTAWIVNTPYQALQTTGGTLEYAIAGTDSETGNPYTGTLMLTYTAYYSSGGGGRGGAGSGWRWIVTGGTLSVSE